MIKARSKSKIKQSIGSLKKDIQEKHKKLSKQPSKKNQEKQNHITKFSMTTIQSKKKIKIGIEEGTQRSVSPLCLNRKKNQFNKNQDEKFIQKLFSQNQKQKQKLKNNNNFFVQKLISGLVPTQNQMNLGFHTSHHCESTDVLKQLHLKNVQVSALQQQIQQLKLQISNFTFKVFDLTVLCRKFSYKIGMQQQSIQFNRKTDEVIAYLDSLIRHWKLEQRMKLHCENIYKRISISSKKKNQDSRKRCHTQSLKIPIQQYLQSLQSTNKKLFQNFNHVKNQCIDEEQSEQIIKILSRRSSGAKRQQQQTYIVIKNHDPKNEHQLQIKIGEKISVLQKNDNDRWLGFKQGRVGYFPKECLL